MANEDKATRYHRLQRRASMAAAAIGATTVLLFLVTGISATVRDAVALVLGPSFFISIAAYVAVLALAYELVQLPLGFYRGVVLERRYGLSTQTTASWMLDRLKAGALGLVFGIAGATLVLSLIAWSPGYWWLLGTVAFAGIFVVLAQLLPVVLLPIFYELKPLDRPALADRLVALTDRALGMRKTSHDGRAVLGVFEWRLSDRTRRANAALTGIGRTRRILISDTLLDDHSDDEIEVILAHEIGHHVHRDIWRGLAAEVLVIAAGLFVADRALALVVDRFGLAGKGDIASLPVVVLAAGAVSLAMRPLANAMSREHERRADRYALEMTGNAGAFIGAMKRLSARNLAEERPSRVVEMLFHSHPPTSARIAAAQAWMGKRD
jgi:STE24 endopeptidase